MKIKLARWIKIVIVVYILFILYSFTNLTTTAPKPNTSTPKDAFPDVTGNSNTLNKNTKPLPIAHKRVIPSKEEVLANSKCKHNIYRDYDKDPVQFSGRDSPHITCPFPCVRGTSDISTSRTCSHVKSFARTMENVGQYIGSDTHIAGNSHLDSDIPMQYFNWIEYDFMIPPKPKTAGAMLVAMISNCGPQKRLHYLQTLMNEGVTVHSYGSCLNNMGSGGGRSIKKADKIASYKFTFAFENSEEDDYVTEKLWEPLSVGSVPIYFGAPNAYKFAPTNHSVIFAQDFKTPEELAKYIKYLDQNDDKYQEYLQWKKDGPSKDWIALLDLSIVHSECRFCIRSADIDRKNNGEVVTGPFEEENRAEEEKYDQKPALLLKVRERGTFWLRYIFLEEYSLEELYSKILGKFGHAKGNIYGTYLLWDRSRTIIKDVESLNYGDELEIIFEDPHSQDRGAFSTWMKNNKL